MSCALSFLWYEQLKWVMYFWWDNWVKPHLSLSPVRVSCWKRTSRVWGSLCMSVMWHIEPTIINPGMLSEWWTVIVSSPQLSPGNRDLLVKHDVPVGMIDHSCGSCLGMCFWFVHKECCRSTSELHDGQAWLVYVRVCVCERETILWLNTPMKHTSADVCLHIEQERWRQWVWSLTVTHIISCAY